MNENEYPAVEPYPIPRTVYVLELEERRLYVGITTNIDDTLKKYRSGYGPNITRLYRPVKVLCQCVFPGIQAAEQAKRKAIAILMHNKRIMDVTPEEEYDRELLFQQRKKEEQQRRLEYHEPKHKRRPYVPSRGEEMD